MSQEELLRWYVKMVVMVGIRIGVVGQEFVFAWRTGLDPHEL
jgi:hypothetical protein